MQENQLREIWLKTGGHCHFCGDPVVFARRGWRSGSLRSYWEVDHVIQRAKGGAVAAENRLPACTRCNRLRWHRTGRDLRELLLLGIIASQEIRRDSAVGQALLERQAQRQRANRRRRARK